jgi:hypothetical protein
MTKATSMKKARWNSVAIIGLILAVSVGSFFWGYFLYSARKRGIDYTRNIAKEGSVGTQYD